MRFLTKYGSEITVGMSVLADNAERGVVTALDDYYEPADSNGDGQCWPKVTVGFPDGSTEVFPAFPASWGDESWRVEELA